MVPAGALSRAEEGIWVLGAQTPRSRALHEREVSLARQPRLLQEAALRRDVAALGAGQVVAGRVRQLTAQGGRVSVPVSVPRGVTATVAQHLLAGDASGGGHEYQAAAFRATRPRGQVVTWFPQAWSGARILEVAHALAQDTQLPVQSEGAVDRPAAGDYAARFSGIALAAPSPGAQAGWLPVKFVFEVAHLGPRAGSRVLVTAFPVSRKELQQFIAAQNTRTSELAAIKAGK
jgi:hypothetical protein